MKLSDLLLKEFNLFSVNDFIHPVYYNFPIALRFEIGIGDIWLNEDKIKDIENGNELILNPEYISTAVNRAMIVFSCAFSDNDEVLLVCDCTPSKDFKSILPRGIKMQRVRIEKTDENTDEICSYYRYIYKMNASDLPIEAISNFIVKAELGGNWRYCSNVYLFNLQTNAMYYLYDDRGADLIATDVETLRPIYTGLNDMLLDCDRKKMDKVFKN